MGREGGGCGIIGIVVIVGLLVIAGLAYLTGQLANYSDKEAGRLYARGALEESYGRSQAEIERAEADARVAIITAESQARLDQAIAAAQMVLAQSESRLNSAQAFAVTAGAGLPWLVVSLTFLAAFVLIASVTAMFGLVVLAVRGRQPAGSWIPVRRVSIARRRPALQGARGGLPDLWEPDSIIEGQVIDR